jgi:3-oxoacyl-[acyl-carrier-protein] synthase-1
MNKTAIYITADNIITSLGFTTKENVNKIAAEQTGVKCHDNKAIYPSPVWVSKISDELLSVAIRKLKNPQDYTRLEQLFLLSIIEATQQTAIDITSDDTLIILASTKGNIDLLEHKNKGNFPANRVQLGTMAAQIQTYFNNPNTPIVVCNACISGVLALDVAKRLLRKNNYKNIIVAGGDLISEFVVSGFQSFKAMSNAPCKPYDKNRVGINLGDGIGTIILSTEKPTNQDDIITLEGGASSNDANHISGPSRTGDGLFNAIDNALNDANFSSSEMDYLSMHGTATPFNDEMESKALDLANLSEVPMNSLKGYIGHTLGAAGVIESIVAIHSLKNNSLYASLGFEELGVPKPINVITKTTEARLHKCLKTASGFGGCNAAVVFAKNSAVVPKQSLSPEEKEQSSISSTCKIKDNKITLNGALVFEKEDLNYAKFIKGAYKYFELDYPKFHKMDRLCKLAFTAANILLKDGQLNDYAPKEIAVVMANSNSTLHTDTKHADSIKDEENHFPSPAVFVYTLPNIMVGEICIKYNIKGQSVFLVSNKFDKEMLLSYSQDMIATGNAKVCLMGWVDYTENDYCAELYLIK